MVILRPFWVNSIIHKMVGKEGGNGPLPFTGVIRGDQEGGDVYFTYKYAP
jgi:hypothetical protein